MGVGPPEIGLHHLVDAKTAETLGNLGDMARYTTAQPKGSVVNNSNTATALLGEAAAGSLEGAANFAARGVPVGTWGRTAAQHIGHSRTVKRALVPGAAASAHAQGRCGQVTGAIPGFREGTRENFYLP